MEVRQQKTGALLSIPCHKALRVELENMPRVAETILVGERGAPLTGSSLSVMVRKALRDMGINGYAIHGLRKNAAVELANAGCEIMEIAAITRPSVWSRIIQSDAISAVTRAPRWISGSEVANSRTERDNCCGKPVDITKNLLFRKKSGLALRLSASRSRDSFNR
jgi:hypothetical protein